MNFTLKKWPEAAKKKSFRNRFIKKIGLRTLSIEVCFPITAQGRRKNTVHSSANEKCGYTSHLLALNSVQIASQPYGVFLVV